VTAAFLRPSLYRGEVPSLLSTALGAATYGSLVSPYFLTVQTGRLRSGFAALLLGTICLALILPTPPYHAASYQDRRALQANFREVAGYLESETPSVLVNGLYDALSLSYASDFALGYDWAGTGELRGRIWTAETVQSFAGVEEDYLLLTHRDPGAAPADWALVRSFGVNTARPLYLYSPGAPSDQ